MAQTRTEIIRQFVPASPLVAELGMRLEHVGDDRAELTLPFRPELCTLGDTVHGGAIAALMDVAGMAAAWSDDFEPESLAGATVNLSINYTAAARGVDLKATGRVVRRGRSLCFCDIEVTDPDGRVVAHGAFTHKYG